MASLKRVVKVRDKLSWLLCMTYELDCGPRDEELELAMNSLRQAQQHLETWLSAWEERRRRNAKR